MKIALIAVALSPALFWLVPAGQAPAPGNTPKIAYVNAQRIVADSPETKAAFAQLPAMQKERATTLRAKQQALETTRQLLAQEGDGPKRIELQQQELQQRTDLERSTVQAQVDLQTLQRQLNVDLQNRVKAVVEELAKGQNIQLVLNESAVVWAGSTTDLTAAVIERLNAK